MKNYWLAHFLVRCPQVLNATGGWVEPFDVLEKSRSILFTPTVKGGNLHLGFDNGEEFIVYCDNVFACSQDIKNMKETCKQHAFLLKEMSEILCEPERSDDVSFEEQILPLKLGGLEESEDEK